MFNPGGARNVTSMAFDVRAMENIATAPASRPDRITAAWIAAAILVFFAIELPLSDIAFAQAAAFVPAVTSAAVLAQILTTIFLYLQYRIARQSQLALLALAYAASSVFILFYMLTFPGVFTPTGLFHANMQSASWLAIFERETFGFLLIAFACADRWNWRIARVHVRWLAFGIACVVAVLVTAAVVLPLPPLLVAGHATLLWYRVIVPLNILTAFTGIGLLALSGLRTVTQVWLIIVALIYCCETVANSVFSGGRYTLGWYAARLYVLLAASIILAVFVVKINDLMLRLTNRNRALTQRTELAELEAAEGEARYRSLANTVPQLIWTANAAGEIDYVNDRWVEYTGLDVRATRNAGWLSALDERGRLAPRVAWNESLRLGRPFGGEYRLRGASTGRLRWFLIDAIPMIDESGSIARWIGTCTDVDRSKRTEEREAFLAAAGDRLSASLDLNATLATIADVITGSMASWSRVDLIAEDGRFINASVSSTMIGEEAELRNLLGNGVSGVLANRFAIVIDGREPVVESDGALLSAPARGIRSVNHVLVPLISGDTALGVLTLGHVDIAWPDAEDLAVARDFGRRAAQALDHARRYERERATADSFQRAMLPQGLPELPNVTFSASYSAASETRRVGGDFYDAFVLPNGRVALTIGDVTGHGLEAAVIMGEIRQSLRAAASFEDAAPSTILDRASRLLIGSGRGVFVTAVFGVLDPRTGVFEYATAGHPSPVVYDGRTTVRLSGSGLPIGLRDDDGVDFALTLPDACTIVLYTDGLIEFARDLDEGERRLDEAIAALDGDYPADIAGAIKLRVLSGEQATDDIAILTATIESLPERAGGEMRRWRFSSGDYHTGVVIRHDVGVLVAAWTGDPSRRYDGELAFGEIFSNVVRHAPGAVEVELRATERGAELRVTDRGAGFRERPPSTDEFAESGRGLELVRAVADACDFSRNAHGGTTVHAVFAGGAEFAIDGWRSLEPRSENLGRP
jgi:PAS domain S-box-containing protein